MAKKDETKKAVEPTQEELREHARQAEKARKEAERQEAERLKAKAAREAQFAREEAERQNARRTAQEKVDAAARAQHEAYKARLQQKKTEARARLEAQLLERRKKLFPEELLPEEEPETIDPQPHEVLDHE